MKTPTILQMILIPLLSIALYSCGGNEQTAAAALAAMNIPEMVGDSAGNNKPAESLAGLNEGETTNVQEPKKEKEKKLNDEKEKDENEEDETNERR